MAVVLDKKTNHYFIDRKIKKYDGTYYHFTHRDNKNDKYKDKEYVKSIEKEMIKRAKKHLENIRINELGDNAYKGKLSNNIANNKEEIVNNEYIKFIIYDEFDKKDNSIKEYVLKEMNLFNNKFNYYDNSINYHRIDNEYELRNNIIMDNISPFKRYFTPFLYFGTKKKQNKTRVRDIEDLVKRFFYSFESECSLNTYSSYKVKAEFIIKFFNNDLHELFDIYRIEDYRNHLRFNGLKNPVYIIVLRNLINYARRIKLIDSDEKDDLLIMLTSIKNKRGNESSLKTFNNDNKNKYTSIKDALRFIENVKSKRMKYLYRLLYFSGLRIGEFLGIKIKDIEFKNNYKLAIITIKRQKLTHFNIISERLKTSASYKRIAYVNENALILKEYIDNYRLKDEDFLVPYSYYKFTYIFNKEKKRNKVKIDNTLQGFGRKSINTELYKLGADNKVRMALLGQITESVNERHYIDTNEAFIKGISYLKKLSSINE